MIKLLIVDDHPAVGEGTKSMLEQESDIEVDVIFNSLEAEGRVKSHSYDVLLLDLYMPNLNGIELAKKIKQFSDDIKIIIYTGFDLNTHFNLLSEADISGFVSKTATKEQLLTVIKCALREEVVLPMHLFKQLRRTNPTVSDNVNNFQRLAISLNEKEQTILDEVSRGLTNREIAEKLHMSQRSVEYSLTSIFNKFGVRSRTEALIKGKELGLISQKS